MPMRTDCKHFQTRTYQSGDTVRKCTLDLAPDAPWRCPEVCDSYAPRLADVNWRHGSLTVSETPTEPESLDSEDISTLLDEAEDIVNQAAPRIQAEVDPESFGISKRKKFKWWPFGKG